MPTLTEFIQNPQAFLLEAVMAENKEYLKKFIELLTVPLDSLLNNERQCYLYPSKVADILSTGMAYRLLIQKKQEKGQSSYPYLEYLFNRLKDEDSEPVLLGYVSKVLISLVKKTPQIYEFVKDNQNILIAILQDDQKLQALRQFLSLFLCESTMQLYVFLKSMLIRNLIFRIVDDPNTGITVYKCIAYFYDQLLKAFDQAAQDQKSQILEVCNNFEEQNLITLLVLKLDSQYSSRNCHIASFLARACGKSQQAASLIALHIDTVLDFLQQYQQSSIFMESIKNEHINILRLLVQLIRLAVLSVEMIGQLIKRLLVYSNVHSSNSLIHNLLFKAVTYCKEQGKVQLLNELNIIQFFIKSQTVQTYGFMSLRRRMFLFWEEHKLHLHLTEEEKQQIHAYVNSRQAKLQASKHYKQFKIGCGDADLGSTKMPTAYQSVAVEIQIKTS